MNHVHVGAMSFLVFLAMFLLAQFLQRWVATTWSDRPLGQAMAALN